MDENEHPKNKQGIGRKILSIIKWLVIGLLGLTIVLIGGLLIVGANAEPPGTGQVPAGYKQNQAVYVTMRDGVKLAVDVWLPEDLAPGEQIPALLRSARYGRTWSPGLMANITWGLGGDFPAPPYDEVAMITPRGYALVLADMRGSGASFGSREILWGPEEVEDLGEIVAWIAEQPWSNGRVGTFGASYEGNTAELTAVSAHPAFRAAAPQYADFDVQFHVMMPGGVYNRKFAEIWQYMNEGFDNNDMCKVAEGWGQPCPVLKLIFTGQKPVDEDVNGELLAQAVAERENFNAAAAIEKITFRDDPVGDSDLTFEDVSSYYLREPIEASDVPEYVMVGWLDSATVDGALSRYLTFSNRQRLLIGPWSHRGLNHTDPFLPVDTPVDPSIEDQYSQLLDFFDYYLKDNPQVEEPEFGITYYTMGENAWHTTQTWPPDGFEPTVWYFGPEGSLTQQAPEIETAVDKYTVDFTATTGPGSRWNTPIDGDDVIYPDRAEEDQKLLTYTSAPMEQDMLITGSPIITLYLASTEADGAFHVYLEDVAPDGTVTYITEGMLRAIHRKVSDEEPPFVQLGPYHTYRSGDAMPLVPGEVADLQFNLYATSVLIREGHRIRIAIAGADADFFARYPDSSTPVWEVHRDSVYPSQLVLPMQPQP